MIEQIIVSIVFLAAIAYLLHIARKNFSLKQSGCVKGCGTCNAADTNKLASQMAKQQKAAK